MIEIVTTKKNLSVCLGVISTLIEKNIYVPIHKDKEMRLIFKRSGVPFVSPVLHVGVGKDMREKDIAGAGARDDGDDDRRLVHKEMVVGTGRQPSAPNFSESNSISHRLTASHCHNFVFKKKMTTMMSHTCEKGHDRRTRTEISYANDDNHFACRQCNLH